MDALPLNPSDQAIPRRRGRPPGARNKGSEDLARFVSASFAGLTPGQQSAKLCLVSAKELAGAKARSKELGIAHPPRDPFLLAMVCKAEELALALNIKRAEAYALMQREREGLMPYIHQRQAPMAEKKPGAQAHGFMIPEGREAGAPMLDLGDDDAIEIIEQSPPRLAQVAQPKSHDDT